MTQIPFPRLPTVAEKMGMPDTHPPAIRLALPEKKFKTGTEISKGGNTAEIKRAE